jgi:hypothetical protein
LRDRRWKGWRCGAGTNRREYLIVGRRNIKQSVVQLRETEKRPDEARCAADGAVNWRARPERAIAAERNIK